MAAPQRPDAPRPQTSRPRPPRPHPPRKDSSGYSRAVRGLKIALPLLALVLLSAIFLLPQEHEFDGGLVYSDADLVQLGEGLSVSSPRIEGATAAGEPFVVEAESATPDRPDPERVDLNRVEAAFTQAEGRRITLDAAQGVLRPRDQTLSLEGDVRLETSDGYRIETQAIAADLKAGTARAPGAVRAEGPAGVIEAGSFRARRVAAAGDGSGGGAGRAGGATGTPAEASAGDGAGDGTGDAPGDGAAPGTLGELPPGDYLWFEDGVRVRWTPPPAAE